MTGLFRIVGIVLIALCSGASAISASEPLVLPVVPDSLRLPSERASYVALHYWDNLNFGDDKRAADVGFMEQIFVDFIDLLNITPPRKAEEASEILLQRASVDNKAISIIEDLAQTYLIDVESPMWSEELSVPYLRHAISRNPDDQLSDELLSDSMKFRPGDEAADFGYYLISDRSEKGKLSDLRGKDTILIFMDPGCLRCREFISRLESYDDLKTRIDEGSVSVLVIVIGSGVSDMSFPRNWQVAVPASGKEDPCDIYSMRVLPRGFLIGKDGKVVLKDFSVQGLKIALGL